MSPEEMDLSEFDSEPGQAVSSDGPQPESAPQEPGGQIFGLEEEPPAPPTPAPDHQQPAGGEESVDLDGLQARLDELEHQNETLRSATGRLGTELEQKNAQLRLFQQAQPQAAGGEAETELIDPEVKTYVDQKLQQIQQQQFLLETAKNDMEFKVKQNISKDTEQLVQTYQMLNGVASFRDAYHSMVGQGIIKPSAEAKSQPRRKVAVEPKPMPTQTGSAPRSQAPPSGEEGLSIDWDKFTRATDQQRAELLKKVGGY